LNWGIPSWEWLINFSPHFAYLDMIDVVNDLKDSGYNFDISCFIFEFRFPHHGNVTIDKKLEN
jgi:uncharacterized protein (DUF2126 family)